MAYFELELENKVLDVLPKIDFKAMWEKFKNQKDSNNEYIFTYIICEGPYPDKSNLLKKFKQLFSVSTFSLEKLACFVMQDSDLTKNFILFVNSLNILPFIER